MQGKRNSFFKGPNPRFKNKSGSRKGRRHNSSREKSSRKSQAVVTVYRILCPSIKIGSVIGKGGIIVRLLREETQSKITVSDSVPGLDERVIIIDSPSTKPPVKKHVNENPMPHDIEDALQLHCPAQDALLKVHDRIIEGDRFGGMAFENENNMVTARLIVSNNTVGCLIGKGGDVIRKLRSETGASIRVLPAEYLPACSMPTDELIQISGQPNVVKRALYEVSTLLHQNPRKDKHPSGYPVTYGDEYSHPSRDLMAHNMPPHNPMWPHRNSLPRGMPQMSWMGGEYRNQPHGFVPESFDGVRYEHDKEGTFSMKVLCTSGKIGGVIGKGGFNLKQLQQETRASIHVEDALGELEERIICISSFEAMRNPRSQTIDAILKIQDKVSEYSEKGIITTRLLVPSSKVGCILGQGGHIINEMRRRTQADIRIYNKDDKPKCASEDEELVQISGNMGIAKDALAEIASRLRERCLRDSNSEVEPPSRPMQGFGPSRSIPGVPNTSGSIGAGSSGGYGFLKVWF